MTPLELAANAVTATSIFLAARNNEHTWWTGIIGCTLFGMLFWGLLYGLGFGAGIGYAFNRLQAGKQG